MKLSAWAKQRGIKYRTAWLWVKYGKMPVPFERTPTGTILVQDPTQTCDEPKDRKVAIYARVSGSDQKADLDRQVVRLMRFAKQNQLSVAHVVTEVGSGLNGRRTQLLKLLADKTIAVVIIEHRDRLMRFGSEYLEENMRASGRKLLIAETAEVADDLVQDMIEVLTSFRARLYGRRSAKNRAQLAVKAIQASA